jgi:hypothetical protein
MKKCGFVLLFLLSGGLLLTQYVTPNTAPVAPQIFLVGSAHDFHFQKRYSYSLIDLQAQVRSLHPDVICGEITPDAYNGPMEGNFPPEAAMLAEMARQWGARFIPADWRVSFALQERAEKQLSEDKKKSGELEAEEKKAKAYLDGFSGVSFYDSVNSSPEFLAMVDHKFEDVIGENTIADISYGAWHERNRKVVENCLTEAGAARRIVFVFGDNHLPQLRRQLAARGLAAHIPPRAFTPAGLGTMPPAVIARWQRNLKNLEGIADGTVAVSADNRAKVKDTNRAPVLRNEIEIYLARPPAVEPALDALPKQSTIDSAQNF